MAVYRFRVTFEDYDEVFREIDMLSKHSFLDLHHAIHRATGYQASVPSSFYRSNDQWKKGEEIAYMPSERKQAQGVIEMEKTRLSKFVNDPHQKFYYIFNFERPFDFHVELIKILKEEEGVAYPNLFKSVGVPPKPFGAPVVITDEESTESGEEEDDFLEETQYVIDETEDLDQLEGEEGDSEDGNESAEDERQSPSGYEDGY